MSRGDLTRLQQTLGHSFAKPRLLVRALTHASAATEDSRKPLSNYQRLEFLGDRVLGLVVADMLAVRFPEASEGELSRRLARLVSRETCAAVARDMGLTDFIRVGGTMEKIGSRATSGVLADVCESVIAALYRDDGLEAARQLIERYWGPRIESMNGPLRDAKTELQEWAHRRGLDAPVYVEIQRSGPDHAPVFEIDAQVGTIAPSRGTGRSKREAEHEAAANLLRREGVWSEG